MISSLAPEVEMSNEEFTYESDIFAIGQLIQTIFLSILPKAQKEDTEENVCNGEEIVML